MAKTLLDLADRLDSLAAKVDESASNHAVETALAMVGDLVYHTPVDTSQALSNWDVTIGAPVSDPHGPYFHGSHGSTLKQSAAQALAVAKQTLKAKKPGQSIFIANRLPYIGILNDGTHSKQPGGFVQRALLIAEKMKAKFKLGK